MFSYSSIDSIILHFYSRKTIELKITDFIDINRIGTVLSGTIFNIVRGVTTVGPQGRSYYNKPLAIIKLDLPLRLKRERVDWVAAIARYSGLGIYGLYFKAVTVHVHSLNSPMHPKEISYESWIYICEMKIKWNHCTCCKR